MKTITIFFCFGVLLCREAAYAQQNRWTVDVSGGLALPVGKFASKNVYDSTSAFAKAGPVINASGSYRIISHFGVTALVSIQKNAVNNKGMASALEAANPDYAFAVDEQAWKLGRALGGAYWEWTLDAKKRFGLRVQALAGVLKVEIPDRKLAQESSYSTGQVVVEEAELSYKVNKLQFAEQFGAELHYAFTRRFFVKAAADYAGTTIHVGYPAWALASRADPGTPPLSFSTGTGTLNPPPGSAPTHYSQPLATINICLGIGMRF